MRDLLSFSFILSAVANHNVCDYYEYYHELGWDYWDWWAEYYEFGNYSEIYPEELSEENFAKVIKIETTLIDEHKSKLK